jgi:hypothetical protein
MNTSIRKFGNWLILAQRRLEVKNSLRLMPFLLHNAA